MDGYLRVNQAAEVATTGIPFILMTGLADNKGMRHGDVTGGLTITWPTVHD